MLKDLLERYGVPDGAWSFTSTERPGSSERLITIHFAAKLTPPSVLKLAEAQRMVLELRAIGELTMAAVLNMTIREAEPHLAS